MLKEFINNREELKENSFQKNLIGVATKKLVTVISSLSFMQPTTSTSKMLRISSVAAVAA